MKTRLPRTLLVALLAGMAVTSSYAEVAAPNMTGAFIVTSENTFGSDADEALSTEEGDKALLEQALIAGSANNSPKPVVKVGQGSYEIDQDIKVNNPLVVREGTLKVTGDIVSMQKSPLTSYVPYLSVGGKNAVLELDGATVSHHIFGENKTDNYSVAMSLGTADGKGTINLKNASVLHTDHFIFAGYNSGMTNGTGAKGTGYSKATLDAEGNRYTGGDYDGPTIINLEGGSTLSAGTCLQFADVTVNINDSELKDNTRGLAPSWSYFGTASASKTTINVTNGGTLNVQQHLLTGYGSQSKTVISASGEGSSIKVAGATLLGYAGVASTTEMTLSAGAKAELGEVTAYNGSVISVGSGSSIVAHSNYAGEGQNPLLVINEGAELNNSGVIALDIELNGGTFTMENGAVAGGLTATSGTVYLNGTVTFTGSVSLGTVSSTLSLFGSATEALTVYIQQGATVMLGTDGVEVDGQTFTVGEGTQFIVELAEGEIYEEGSQLFTLAAANETLLAAASQEIAAKTTVTWLNEEGTEQQAGYGAGESAPLYSGSITTVTVPEPATATLSLLALAGLCARRRRK